ncbi:hypothetical protein RHS04_08587 [Rhizoctonia solani]|uniref:Uncharacterized protein n=1 Tax=Rhizoctonia solani TaxID=456999 RepID=A0A8H7H1X6_9AGAM|nr:hypothetical protein RHS04_08587 [Rhizoctonia solani]
MTAICPTAPPPPPPPSGTVTSTNPPTPLSPSSNLKFAKPNKFSGKKEDTLNFIIVMTHAFAGMSPDQPTY